MQNSSRSNALIALVLLVPAPSVGTYCAMYALRGAEGQAIYGICKLWLAAMPLAWWLWIDKGKLGWSPLRQGGWLAGLSLGIVIAAAILLGYELFGKNWIDVEKVRQAAATNGIGSPAIYLLFSAYLILVNSLLEEYVWRWFCFRKCETFMPGWLAVTASACCFTIHHTFALRAQFSWRITVFGSCGVFIGGAVWSWWYLRYRSIWPGYLSHVMADVAILLIGWRLLFS